MPWTTSSAAVSLSIALFLLAFSCCDSSTLRSLRSLSFLAAWFLAWLTHPCLSQSSRYARFSLLFARWASRESARCVSYSSRACASPSSALYCCLMASSSKARSWCDMRYSFGSAVFRRRVLSNVCSSMSLNFSLLASRLVCSSSDVLPFWLLLPVEARVLLPVGMSSATFSLPRSAAAHPGSSVISWFAVWESKRMFSARNDGWSLWKLASFTSGLCLLTNLSKSG
mmetsp:Transcript_42447/g.98781  ORF Transcript_42447/g.98781 Transcript_42447/m.98781 type:complete len:227 (+) Transcript_42447:869-1549(+)